MSNPKLIAAAQRLFSSLHQFAKKLTRTMVLWLLRSLLRLERQPHTNRGIVLPTTILLLLVLTLTVGAITLRTYNRTNQAVGERQQRVIYNAASPAIDRAKAKLEFMFSRNRDTRFPSGIPGQLTMNAMLLNDGQERNGLTVGKLNIENESGTEVDPYTFPDEKAAAKWLVDNGIATADTVINIDNDDLPERLDIDADGLGDNVWVFRTDTNGDGSDDATVAYSIIMMRPLAAEQDDPDPMDSASDEAIAARAANLQIRHGPLSLNTTRNAACSFGDENSGEGPAKGWFVDPAVSSILRKNFQVDVFVLPDDQNGTVSTLEFHQDRRMDQGNKWGAWFRNDLEIFPGPAFRWNGAMHTEGNLITGNSSFHGYLISSPHSCLYSRTASEVTIADIPASADDNVPPFQGQFISGKTNDNTFGDSNKFHYHTNNGGVAETLSKSTDSVKDSGSADLIDFTLDPIFLTTENVSKARGFDCPDPDEDGNVDMSACDSPEEDRDNNWADRKLHEEGRLYNRSEPAPYVDDAFRADNRYGPGPRVSGKSIPGKIGEPIQGDRLNSGERQIADTELILDKPADTDTERTELGLDGYWERRARDFGLRIIVGERLELGNAHGWGGGIDGKEGQYRYRQESNWDAESLLPWTACESNSNKSGDDKHCLQARQNRALYDNLAAVQATVFYHADQPEDPPYHDQDDLDFPTACMASTVHPGTPDSLILSAAFKNYKAGISTYLKDTATTYTSNPVVSNFFLGMGTNGWEYTATPDDLDDETKFGNAVEDEDSPLGIALRNLAYFAGDPKAGTPSFQPVDNTTDANVHPYPLMSMWGDFSVLRRVLAIVDGQSFNEGNPFGDAANPDSAATAKDYDDLSPADKATLHTAACTLGMLAYNIGFLEAFDYSKVPAAKIQALTGLINDLKNGGAPNGVRDNINSGEPPEAYLASLKQWNLKDDTAVPDDIVALAEMIVLKEQVERDREFGFGTGFSANSDLKSYAPFPFNGDYSPFWNSLTTDQPKFPALHYLFPNNIASSSGSTPDDTQLINEYDVFTEGDEASVEDGTDVDGNGDPVGDSDDVRDATVRDLNTIGGARVKFRAIDLRQESVLDKIAIHPKPMSDWVLPHENAGTGDTNQSNTDVMIGCLDDGLCSTNPGSKVFALERVGFKDTVIYNGREILPARSMDVNFKLIRLSSTGLTNDTWLPRKGIIYAFREDAVREDEINRPTSGTWANCGNDAEFSDPSVECRMNASTNSALDSKDPPLNPKNRISPKAVDYYPDPDRRPYGFRLRNGERLGRANDEGRGLSFITDNPVYIMGDFNLHQTTTCNGADSCRLEEFVTKLDATNFTNFYSRSDLDPAFARPATDDWRPSEILADAITVISERYCDGSAVDVLSKATTNKDNLDGNDDYRFQYKSDFDDQYNCSNYSKKTSFLNTTYPTSRENERALLFHKYDGSTKFEERWHHLNPYDALWYREDWEDRLRSLAPLTPVVWTRNGDPMRFTSNGPKRYDDGYKKLKDGKQLISGATNRVNAIIISGLTPSRKKQAYGGLHNFPRFIEDWNTLFISGSLLQLNFSRYATGPFSQSGYETGVMPSGEHIKYYSPPNRRWGYDVGLQYAPAGPLSSRFINPSSSPRSEFYSEPPADDPYMVQLCEMIASDPDNQCAP